MASDPHHLPHGHWRGHFFHAYDIAVDVVILGVIPLMLIALGFAFIEAIASTIHLFPDFRLEAMDSLSLSNLVNQILDVVILIELFNTFMDYARTRHIRLSTLLDVSVVFSVRELLIKLYGQKFSSETIVTLVMVILVLAVARSITLRFSPNPSTRA